jgi:hypothetical protein
MRPKTLAAAAMAVITAALGLSVITASPAAAETMHGDLRPYGETNPIRSSNSTAAAVDVGTWRSYATDPINAGSSTWRCGAAKSIGADISGRPCIIRTADRQYVQGAVVILNNRSTTVPVVAAVVVWPEDGVVYEPWEWHCSRSGVGARSWSVCFSDSFRFADRAETNGGANGHDLQWSGAL